MWGEQVQEGSNNDNHCKHKIISVNRPTHEAAAWNITCIHTTLPYANLIHIVHKQHMVVT